MTGGTYRVTRCVGERAKLVTIAAVYYDGVDWETRY